MLLTPFVATVVVVAAAVEAVVTTGICSEIRPVDDVPLSEEVYFVLVRPFVADFGEIFFMMFKDDEVD